MDIIETYTPTKRLLLYNEMLALYNNHKTSKFFRRSPEAIPYFGFCHYLMNKHDIFEIKETNLPELYNQKPKKGWRVNDRFWWKPQNAKRRIKAIEDAIAECKSLTDES